ncbi:MAG: glycosyltransferase family 4 protein [Oligoflexia bacterium]|nr:glycosyltransferase family 4 protein [Oligoflexia bacterium]
MKTSRHYKKIIHIIFTRCLGGAERSAINTIQALLQQSLDVTFLVIFDQRYTTSHSKQLLIKNLHANKIPHYILSTNHRFSLSTLKQILLLAQDADIIHSHGDRSDMYIFFIKLIKIFLKKTPHPLRIVTTQHGHANGNLRSRINQTIGHFLKFMFDTVIVVSGELKKNNPLYKYNSKCMVIPNFTPMLTLTTSPIKVKETFFHKHKIIAKGRIIGWLGRMEMVKGPKVFLSALENYNGNEELTILIAGDGSLLKKLKYEQKTMHFSPKIYLHFLGEIDDVAAFFAILDLFVMSSYLEGTPMVLLEAIASEVPFIAPNIGGIPSMLPASNNNNNFLFPVGNSKALASLLWSILLKSKEELLAITKNNKSVLQEKYSMQSILKELMEVAYEK